MSYPRLSDLRPSYQAVTAYACEVLKVFIATKNAFPNDIEANALIREAFYVACQEHGKQFMYDMFTGNAMFGTYILKLVSSVSSFELS